MCRVLHKCIFKTLATNNFGVRNFVQFVLELTCISFLSIIWIMLLNPHIYLKARLSVPCFNSNFNQCSHLPGGTVGYPAPPRLIRPWVRPSVRTCLQIRYSAENSTGPTDSVKFSSKSWIQVIVNQKFFEIKYTNERKHSK